jgi:lysophospholipase L1-like esterase
MLQQAGYTNIDFVGSSTSSTCTSVNINNDKNHEGHAGYLAINIANQNQLVGWLTSNPADIITMNLGTNDIAQGKSTADILKAFSTLVDQMRTSNPKMKIIVGLISRSIYFNS